MMQNIFIELIRLADRSNSILFGDFLVVSQCVVTLMVDFIKRKKLTPADF